MGRDAGRGKREETRLNQKCRTRQKQSQPSVDEAESQENSRDVDTVQSETVYQHRRRRSTGGCCCDIRLHSAPLYFDAAEPGRDFGECTTPRQSSPALLCGRPFDKLRKVPSERVFIYATFSAACLLILFNLIN